MGLYSVVIGHNFQSDPSLPTKSLARVESIDRFHVRIPEYRSNFQEKDENLKRIRKHKEGEKEGPRGQGSSRNIGWFFFFADECFVNTIFENLRAGIQT